MTMDMHTLMAESKEVLRTTVNQTMIKIIDIGIIINGEKCVIIWKLEYICKYILQ